MKYSIMKESDIQKFIPLYIDYYNNQEDSIWTIETTYKRIHQVWSREDSYCFILEDNDIILGFAMGYLEQYDDLKAYDLVEIVIDYKYQNQGYGKMFMLEIEKRVKEVGASMIQLQAVNDDIHNNFYGKLDYKNAGNLILKSKWI
ncbi:GNAT family N-acetyltransferase [Clostridium sp. D53t1_180928_C8]|uniref:GNAT family N-acetyltransferase n=1 Tax=Clostridium sp. D53t1_180928_C8 TaxID=2787101 RepID=UPI001A9B70D9